MAFDEETISIFPTDFNSSVYRRSKPTNNGFRSLDDFETSAFMKKQLVTHNGTTMDLSISTTNQ